MKLKEKEKKIDQEKLMERKFLGFVGLVLFFGMQDYIKEGTEEPMLLLFGSLLSQTPP